MQFFKLAGVMFFLSLILSGCSRHATENTAEKRYQEDILIKANNYSGLITLYRERVKNNDSVENRIALSKYYYLTGDYQSALYYLKPLQASSNTEALKLQAKSLLAVGRYQDVIPLSEAISRLAPKDPDAWNLKAIALALSGRISEAERAMQTSRDLFIDDEVALNNLAMLDIMQQRYQKAIAILLPLYLRGKKQEQLVHNLVLSLVKFGDRNTARSIIENENLSAKPEELMDALLQISQTAGGYS